MEDVWICIYIRLLVQMEGFLGISIEPSGFHISYHGRGNLVICPWLSSEVCTLIFTVDLMGIESHPIFIALSIPMTRNDRPAVVIDFLTDRYCHYCHNLSQVTPLSSYKTPPLSNFHVFLPSFPRPVLPIWHFTASRG